MKLKKKKVLAFIIIIFPTYYFMTGGLKDNKGFCSSYIPQIEEYMNKHSDYPDNLNNLEKALRYRRYEASSCNYARKSNTEAYMHWTRFYEIWGYDFNTKEYWME